MNDKNKMRDKFWDLAGTKMGNLLKVSDQQTPNQTKLALADGHDAQTADNNTDEVNYKEANQYASALKG